jgi:glucose-1-phosphate adenylyltransferase
MDLIGENPVFRISDKNSKIYSRNMARPPQFVGPRAKTVNSMISEGCRSCGSVENSVLSGGVVIEEGAIVRDSVIMDDVVIKSGACVYTAIIDSDSVISPGVTVGTPNAGKDNITVIAKGSVVTASADSEI